MNTPSVVREPCGEFARSLDRRSFLLLLGRTLACAAASAALSGCGEDEAPVEESAPEASGVSLDGEPETGVEVSLTVEPDVLVVDNPPDLDELENALSNLEMMQLLLVVQGLEEMTGEQVDIFGIAAELDVLPDDPEALRSLTAEELEALAWQAWREIAVRYGLDVPSSPPLSFDEYVRTPRELEMLTEEDLPDRESVRAFVDEKLAEARDESGGDPQIEALTGDLKEFAAAVFALVDGLQDIEVEPPSELAALTTAAVAGTEITFELRLDAAPEGVDVLPVEISGNASELLDLPAESLTVSPGDSLRFTATVKDAPLSPEETQIEPDASGGLPGRRARRRPDMARDTINHLIVDTARGASLKVVETGDDGEQRVVFTAECIYIAVYEGYMGDGISVRGDLLSVGRVIFHSQVKEDCEAEATEILAAQTDRLTRLQTLYTIWTGGFALLIAAVSVPAAIVAFAVSEYAKAELAIYHRRVLARLEQELRDACKYRLTRAKANDYLRQLAEECDKRARR
jgi:hypothetical protein